MKNKIYTLDVDDQLDLKFEELQQQFASGEKIINTSVNENKMIITTEINDGRVRNLLLEDIAKGQVPPEVLGLKKD